MTDLDKIQSEQAEWAFRNFGADVPTWQPLLGVVEEVGELSHAYLKRAQGIRGMDEAAFNDKATDAVGDILIYLLDFCTRNGWQMSEILERTWDHVKGRDWKANPEGLDQGEGCAVCGGSGKRGLSTAFAFIEGGNACPSCQPQDEQGGCEQCDYLRDRENRAAEWIKKSVCGKFVLAWHKGNDCYRCKHDKSCHTEGGA